VEPLGAQEPGGPGPAPRPGIQGVVGPAPPRHPTGVAGVAWRDLCLDAPVLTWTDDRTVATPAGTRFVTLGEEGSFARSLAGVAGIESTPDRFVLLKSRQCVDRYVEIVAALAPQRIVELGIFRGGSTALLLELARPEALLAVEYEPEPVAALQAYLTRGGPGAACRAEYGVDQADTERLAQLVAETFGGDDLDLVVDDASHLGPQTRASFEALFPRLRPGGLYVVEDWSWHLQGLDLPGESMAAFVADLLTAAGRGPGLVAGIEVAWDVLVVRRGAAAVAPGTFSLADWFERML
jgi:hypothetical protein